MAYIDETGDPGDPTLKGSSGCFGLGCVLVDTDHWADSFDRLVRFRRTVRDHHGIPMRAELKANFLIRGSGPLKDLNLPPERRGRIYRSHLNLIHQLKGRAFGVVIDKEATGLTGKACLISAWQTLIERLESTTRYEQTDVLVVHDEGSNDEVRKLMRKARRHMIVSSLGGASTQNLRTRRFLEDPVPRQSHASYWLQLADMVAYSAWRANFPPGANVARVVPQDMWNALGPAVHAPVNRISGGVPGIVVRRKKVGPPARAGGPASA